MAEYLHCSIDQPIRKGLSWKEMWRGSDHGLIYCWERGRQKRIEDPGLATRAEQGELMILVWKGGVEKKLLTNEKKFGSFQYLATWQGLRGEDLDIALDEERIIVCSKTGQTVIFSSKLPVE